ncbi:DNA-dependent RNA polymerase II largest subunit [Singapore grouper iridovirus]|uniref:DNA-directed RNA polymerase subunit n=1 Tax=Singapore grouper iridovirus TaxID=262968 RepID=Q5YFG1_9VIRU|nr:DNA-dependent RNA polymerase II largest subunit [Singapore grouper iridovirus]AAS18119.1 DNA-dependent RNA polymerase II largest subunit [Singapore grouper iridovirus]WAU86813.1 DNA-dependent RNA polymerase II largest subunit [Singapore grouper iridovirus]
MWSLPTRVNQLKFGLCSDEEIFAISTVEIDKPVLRPEQGSVYDPRLGLMGDEDPYVVCPTCEKGKDACPGHFGHIELAAPVVLFYKEAALWAKRCCHGCGALSAAPKAPALAAFSTCENCGYQHPLVRLLDAQDPSSVCIKARRKDGPPYDLDPSALGIIFDRVSDASVDRALGRGVGAHKRFHPRRLVLTKLPVLPPCCRPCVRQWPEGGVQDDDLSVFMSQIIKINNKIKNLPAQSELAPALIEQLRFKILCFVDNSKGKAMHTTNRKPMAGIKERLSKKTGILRQNIMGKRRNQTGRSVVGPDGTLKLNEVGVPEEIAKNLTVPERVTPFNLERLTRKLGTGEITSVTLADGTKLQQSEWSPEHGDYIETECGKELGRVTHPARTAALKNVVVRCHVTGRVKERGDEFEWPKLEPGMTVERVLEDGDSVALNRQPTLHRNSMLGMRVKRLPGKTIRLNLSVTAGFNMDFDGDEGNLYLPQGPQAIAETLTLMAPRNVMMSTRGPSAEVVLVQDAVLGAHLMSINREPSPRDERACCLLEALGIEGWDASTGPAAEATSPLGLLELLLPRDFNLKCKDAVITAGKIVKGHVTKKILKTIIKLLYLEYGEDAAAEFTDKVQFIVNKWLTCRPFSAGYVDCLPADDACAARIRSSVYGKFAQAETALTETDVCVALCGARDLGQNISKDSLAPDNRLAVMARAESKGDLFNLTQITGLLGQQYVSGARPGYEIENGRRTMPHYPRVWSQDQIGLKYESRGFIENSFLSGLNPQQVFFHAKSGREGMISTSQMTGVTGYAERKMVKLNEDMVAAYDGTVRDAMNNIVQFIYGGHGLDPQRCYSDGEPVNFERLAERLSARAEKNSSELVSPVSTETEALALLPDFMCPGAPEPVRMAMMKSHADRVLRGSLANPCAPGLVETWKNIVSTSYVKAILNPGEAVGVLCAQSIGAKQTQQTLDTFHKAGGRLDSGGSRQFSELLNLSQKPKRRQCIVPLNVDPEDEGDKVRDAIGCQFVRRSLEDLLVKGPLVPKSDKSLILNLDMEKCFDLRIHPGAVAAAVEQKFPPPHFTVQVRACCVVLKWQNNCPISNLLASLMAVQVGEMPGIESYRLCKDLKNRWVAVTNGSNLKAFLAHPMTITAEVLSDDIWDVYKTLGLVAAKKRLHEMMTGCVGDNLHSAHIKLLVDRMMRRGRPTPIDRYTMRTCEVGPLSRAAFEESLDILTGAGSSAETELCKGAGARVVAGLPVKMGTGYMDLIYKQEPSSFFDPFF